jgi:hypothetical protein
MRNDAEPWAMSASDKSAPGETPDLRNFSGPLVLVGAGKMGSALIDGWLRFGLDAGKLVLKIGRASWRDRV